MADWRHAGAGGSDDPDGGFGKVCFQEQRVGDNTDVSTETHNGDFQLVRFCQSRYLFRQLFEAKVDFPMIVAPFSAAVILGWRFQPRVPLMQWGTGSFCPS